MTLGAGGGAVRTTSVTALLVALFLIQISARRLGGACDTQHDKASVE
ncbi:hypothetical protein KPY62_10160 [Psychrobacter sp. TAE2020]|nr:hypothetical protein [Psychrobacter sp. TAE2020]MBU5617448.1 hypothetical protein [Psychrobacter sp. TAE2020]